MHVSGRFNIFDMVDIDLFIVVVLNMMVLKLGYTGESKPIFYNCLRPLTSLDEGLRALAFEEDVRCLATLVRSFKLIEVIDDVMRQLSFDETELDGEAGFADVAGSVVDSSGWEDAEHGNDQEDKLAHTNGQFFYYDEGIDTAYETEYDVQSREDADTDDDDDVDEDFLVDDENEIVVSDVDVHLFGISMDLPFDNIGITNLVPDDVLEREDMNVINADGFDSDPVNDEDRNYRKRRLAELRTKIEGHVDQLERLGYMLPQDIIVGLILNGLTKDFARFMRNYNMHNIGKTIGELHAMLIEYEKGLPKKDETPQVMMIKGGKIQNAKKKSLKAKGKGKANGNGNDKQVCISKRKNPKPYAKEHPAKDDACHHYKEVGHWKRNCPVSC
uniref:Zinc finger, CCHC-type n=1 Tax=Tanacetum cinerariifolium TaxID=118510 RepID=A0A6L2LW21_TANCI|nr:hypothetical protein [Tanacetum cinerariifolium]